MPRSIVPPAVSGAVNVPWPVLGSGTTNRERVPRVALLASPDTAGNCPSMFVGTVKLPAEAGATQLNANPAEMFEPATLAPVGDPAAPITETSPVPPPVHVTVSGEARGIGFAMVL